jgi:ABC-type multidrug transport system fused ATPase/permease subunit
MSTGTALLYLVGSLQVLSQALTLGSVLVFANYLAQLYRPIESLSSIIATMAGAQAGLDRSLQILESQEQGEKSTPEKPDLAISNGKILFENVSFAYCQRQLVISDFSLQVNPAELVAIVGPSGQGKSTLLSLLAGFYNPTSGRILIDGNDIQKYSSTSLRSSLSLVLQDSILFAGSIVENIGYSRPSASIDEIINAAKRAEADSFITQFPSGYQTLIGDGGVRLSGGQRQRISIARAFLRDAPILLLDEPTSSLDHTTEAKISNSILRLAHGRTTILVTHRLAIADCADRVVVLEKGRVVEEGAPDKLIKANGHYATLKQASISRFPV